jgi:hypothetical protein
MGLLVLPVTGHLLSSFIMFPPFVVRSYAPCCYEYSAKGLNEKCDLHVKSILIENYNQVISDFR